MGVAQKKGFILGACLLLAQCNNIPQSTPKEVGIPFEQGNSIISPVDHFVIHFALLDAQERLVHIKSSGSRSNPSSLENLCGQQVEYCDCILYDEKREARLSPLKTLHRDANSLQCNIPSAVIDPTKLTHAQIKKRESSLSSALIPIEKESVEIDVIMGSYDRAFTRTKIKRIYEQECTHYYLEGQGVGVGSVTCNDPINHLLLRRSHHLYDTWKTDRAQKGASNFSVIEKKQKDYEVEGGVCGRAHPELICKKNPRLLFGLYESNTGPFTKAIRLSPPPLTGSQEATIYGYAAEQNEDLKCPIGLIKARDWNASIHSPFTIPNNFPAGIIQIIDTQEEKEGIPYRQRKERLERRNATGSCLEGVCPLPNGALETAVESSFFFPVAEICVIPARELN